MRSKQSSHFGENHKFTLKLINGTNITNIFNQVCKTDSIFKNFMFMKVTELIVNIFDNFN